MSSLPSSTVESTLDQQLSAPQKLAVVKAVLEAIHFMQNPSNDGIERAERVRVAIDTAQAAVRLPPCITTATIEKLVAELEVAAEADTRSPASKRDRDPEEVEDTPAKRPCLDGATGLSTMSQQ